MADKKPSRRDVLKKIGVSGAALGGSVGTAAGNQSTADEELPDIVELSGKRRKKALNTLKKDDELRSIFTLFKKEGLKYRHKEAKVAHVTEANGVTRHIALFPFEPRNKGHGKRSSTPSYEESYIIYTDADKLSTEFVKENNIHNVEGHRIEVVENEKSVSTQSVTAKTKDIHRTFVEDNEIHTTSDRVSSSSPTVDDGVSTQGHSCKTCYREITVCNEVNHSCAAWKVSGAIGTVGACAGCAASSGWATFSCGLCFNALAGSALAPDCDIGKDCSPTYECVSYNMEPSYC